MTACTPEMMKQVADGTDVFFTNLDIPPTDRWPEKDLREALPFFMDLLNENPENFVWLVWITIHTQKKVAAGGIGFKGAPDENGVVEIGYSIMEEFRNQGLALEAAKAMCTWAFSKKNIKSVIASCNLDNFPSIKVLERLGMTRTHVEDALVWWKLENPS